MKSSEPAKVGNENNAAKEALTDMPPRSEDELDQVTLHNQVMRLTAASCLTYIRSFIQLTLN